MHVTLKFLGELSQEAVEETKGILETIHASAVEIQFRGYGFFPGTRAPRVFWLGTQAGPQLSSLAAAIDVATSSLSITKPGSRKEEHVFSPHLTLARASGGSGSPKWRDGDGPNRNFQRLQERLAGLPTPEFGAITAREFFLYQSELSPKGSRYTKLASFALR
jgi:2'-5' RNA ligase